ncbi:unnamed protein product [Pedinophyceae sp. YPF-701]|nr:unnamed protein product [Pedinophyceae sp. YPF-701]
MKMSQAFRGGPEEALRASVVGALRSEHKAGLSSASRLRASKEQPRPARTSSCIWCRAGRSPRRFQLTQAARRAERARAPRITAKMTKSKARAKKGSQRGQASDGAHDSKGPRAAEPGGPPPPASAGGRGARADRPYDLTVKDLLALLRSSPGGVVDLGGKTVWLKGGLLLRDEQGATISNGTLIDGCVALDGDGPVGTGTETRIRLRNLTFRGPGCCGKRAAATKPVDPTTVALSCKPLVSVHGAVGVVIEGCTFANAGLLGKDARSAEVSDDMTAGVRVTAGSVTVENCRFVNNDGPGVWAGCGGEPVTVTVRNSQFVGNRYCAAGVYAGARMELEGGVVGGTRHSVIVTGGGRLRARGTVFRGDDVGVEVQGESAATLEGCTFDGCCITAQGGTVTVSDAKITGAPRFGVSMLAGARGTVRGAKISGSAGLGVFASRLVASDVVCVGNEEAPACGVFSGGVLQLERSTFTKTGHGLCAIGRGSIEATDVVLRGYGGCGVSAFNGGSVVMRGGSISGGQHGVGIRGAGTTVRTTDTDITGCSVACVDAEGGARVVLAGGRVTGSKGAGVVAHGAGTTVTVSRVECARNAGGDFVREEGGSVVVDEDAVME